jgi:hypothetical protein
MHLRHRAVNPKYHSIRSIQKMMAVMMIKSSSSRDMNNNSSWFNTDGVAYPTIIPNPLDNA